MPVMPQTPATMSKDWITQKPIPNRLYAALTCMLYWLNAIDSTNTFKSDFKTLLKQYPNVDTAAMGFPTNWENEPLWK